MPRKPKSYHQKTILDYKADDLMEMVYDVERYPEFLPWCAGARILQKKENFLEVELTVGHGFIRIPFISHVRIIPDKKRITMTSNVASGPLSMLESSWEFNPLEKHKTEIVFDICFALSSTLFSKILDLVFNRVCLTMLDSFTKRAEKIFKQHKP